MTTHHGYSTTQIALHWTVFALVVVNFLLGDGMEEVFRAREDGEAASYGAAYAHVAIGVSILLLMVARLLARMGRPVATAPGSPHRVLAVLGKVTHYAFYAILIVAPLLGALAWFGRSEGAGDLHGLLVQVLFWLILLHVAAALFHQFVLRDGLIRRIVRPT